VPDPVVELSTVQQAFGNPVLLCSCQLVLLSEHLSDPLPAATACSKGVPYPALMWLLAAHNTEN
jgi:hypothetical protein